MKRLEIFEPAMCCATGVCGPSIDPELMRVAMVLNGISKDGIDIKRHNLSSEPQNFIACKVVSDMLTKDGVDVLPITLLDGEFMKAKAYPTNEEFALWLGLKVAAKRTIKRVRSCRCGSGSCC